MAELEIGNIAWKWGTIVYFSRVPRCIFFIALCQAAILYLFGTSFTDVAPPIVYTGAPVCPPNKNGVLGSHTSAPVSRCENSCSVSFPYTKSSLHFILVTNPSTQPNSLKTIIVRQNGGQMHMA